jgi:hypothetical protein
MVQDYSPAIRPEPFVLGIGDTLLFGALWKGA